MRRGLPLLAIATLPSCVSAPPPRAPAVEPQPVKAAEPAPAFQVTGHFEQGGIVTGTVPVGAQSLMLDGRPIPFAADRRFLIAFDRDAGPQASLLAMLADGRQVPFPMTIAPRAWDISRLSTLPKYPVPSAEFARVRPTELAQIAAARAIVTDATGWRQPFQWPATGRISTLFGSQRIYKGGEKGAFHSGVDVAVPTGTPVRAPADGVVILATDHPFLLEGNLLMVDHGMGLNSAFLHLSHIDVRVGDHVRQGDVIAESGASGRATGPHLHWGMVWRDARIDPLLAAGPMPR